MTDPHLTLPAVAAADTAWSSPIQFRGNAGENPAEAYIRGCNVPPGPGEQLRFVAFEALTCGGTTVVRDHLVVVVKPSGEAFVHFKTPEADRTDSQDGNLVPTFEDHFEPFHVGEAKWGEQDDGTVVWELM